ncbi:MULTISPECIES: DUF4227 family protein [unclassified Sporolactobacillus]|uniref:DUF4227 family protein n=1 Tax=unclassified Sporolactobacillus TaxID=2628533 RepID=UPI002368B496|nr:DUF4227 family protein [Sporolactobacillus sp. CQH2019]MDD9148608.1 DUF4227 family protein [Sporolactobacillus sp. CQH2019]
MKEYLQITLRVWKMLIVFIALTVFFYLGLAWVDRQQANFHRYDERGNDAVKVSAGQQPAGMLEDSARDFWMRIREFLQDGE